MVNNTFVYVAYGLSIRSAIPLPELVVGEMERENEVSIRYGRVNSLPSEILEKGWGCFSSAPQEDYLVWEEVGSFLVRGGRDIIVDPSPRLDEKMLRLFILGPVLAVLLHQRGHLLLHASAVAMADEAVLFLGDTGWGKSTMAAALCARGYNLVTDDVAVLRTDARGSMLFPGYPQLKLWPEALVSLGDDPEKLPRCNPHFEKRARPVTQNFSLDPILVKRIYVLDQGDNPEILPLRPQSALGELIRHTYGALDVGSSSHFLQSASIVKQVDMCSLRRKKSLVQLPNLARLIEADLTQSN
jgi:hypothetical protein